MRLIVQIFLSSILINYMPISFAQNADNALTLTGTVSLDFGVAPQDYIVEVTVSNHSILVIPPFFAITHPLLSRVSKNITILQGQSSVDYILEGISTEAVDYVIDFRCESCNGVFTPQYYTKTGNSFSIKNDVYIDPEDLPTNLNFTLTSGISISGTVKLPDNKNASKDLIFLLSVTDSTNPTSIFRRISLVIPKGNNSTTYSIDKLIREKNLIGFDLALECLNCAAGENLLINYPSSLDSSTDHTDIDFVVDFQNTSYLPAVLHLLDETQTN